MIIIETPVPPVRERLVLVPVGETHAHCRDATPADLERAGYVLRGGRQDLDCAISDLTAQVREAVARAERAEAHIKSLHDAEQATRRILDAVICEPTADAAARLHHNWVATRERAETAEADATLAQQQRATMYERAEEAERERDEALERFEQSEAELSAETIRADEWKAKCIEAEASLSAAESANAECHELLAAETARAEQAERALRCQCSEPGDSPCRVHDEERADAAERNLSAALERAEKAEAVAAMTERERIRAVAEIRARAERAEHERNDLLEGDMREARTQRERADQAERELDEARAELHAIAPVEGEMPPPDDVRIMSSGLTEAVEVELVGIVDAAIGRLDDVGATLVSRGSASGAAHTVALDAYRLGVAHERARQPAQDRATDEELVAIFENAYEHGALENIVGVRAVAAHVRGERCLIARAVAVGEGFSVTRRATGAGWRIRMVGGPGAECAPADVPATLARLLGEVSRG